MSLRNRRNNKDTTTTIAANDEKDKKSLSSSSSTTSSSSSWLMNALMLFLSHGAAALLAPIGDCDETFNYYEPVHYLLFGVGQQTWEYSAEFALAFLALHCAAHAGSARILCDFVFRPK
jgi:hypothetical protein